MNEEIWKDENQNCTSVAYLVNKTNDIEITQTLKTKSFCIDQKLRLSTGNLSDILAAATGRTVGKLSGQGMQFSSQKDQLYSWLRENFNVVRFLAYDKGYAEEFLHQSVEEGNTDSIRMIRAIAAAVLCELIDRSDVEATEEGE